MHTGALDDGRALAAEAWAARDLMAHVRPGGGASAGLVGGELAPTGVRVVPRGYLETHIETYTLPERGDAEAAIALMRPYYERHEQLTLEALSR